MKKVIGITALLSLTILVACPKITKGPLTYDLSYRATGVGKDYTVEFLGTITYGWDPPPNCATHSVNAVFDSDTDHLKIDITFTNAFTSLEGPKSFVFYRDPSMKPTPKPQKIGEYVAMPPSSGFIKRLTIYGKLNPDPSKPEEFKLENVGHVKGYWLIAAPENLDITMTWKVTETVDDGDKAKICRKD